MKIYVLKKNRFLISLKLQQQQQKATMIEPGTENALERGSPTWYKQTKMEKRSMKVWEKSDWKYKKTIKQKMKTLWYVLRDTTPSHLLSIQIITLLFSLNKLTIIGLYYVIYLMNITIVLVSHKRVRIQGKHYYCNNCVIFFYVWENDFLTTKIIMLWYIMCPR